MASSVVDSLKIPTLIWPTEPMTLEWDDDSQEDQREADLKRVLENDENFRRILYAHTVFCSLLVDFHPWTFVWGFMGPKWPFSLPSPESALC